MSIILRFKRYFNKAMELLFIFLFAAAILAAIAFLWWLDKVRFVF